MISWSSDQFASIRLFKNLTSNALFDTVSAASSFKTVAPWDELTNCLLQNQPAYQAGLDSDPADSGEVPAAGRQAWRAKNWREKQR